MVLSTFSRTRLGSLALIAIMPALAACSTEPDAKNESGAGPVIEPFPTELPNFVSTPIPGPTITPIPRQTTTPIPKLGATPIPTATPSSPSDTEKFTDRFGSSLEGYLKRSDYLAFDAEVYEPCQFLLVVYVFFDQDSKDKLVADLGLPPNVVKFLNDPVVSISSEGRNMLILNLDIIGSGMSIGDVLKAVELKSADYVKEDTPYLCNSGFGREKTPTEGLSV